MFTDEILLQARGANTLRPVTIKQVLEASQPHPEADFKIDDADLSHVGFFYLSSAIS